MRDVVRDAGYSGVAEASKAFSPAFDAAYTGLLQRKLGLTALKLGSNWSDILRSEVDEANETIREASPDARFVLELFRLMASCRADFTDTWRALSDVPALSVALHTTRPAGLPSAGRHQHRAGVDASDLDQDRAERVRDRSSNKYGSAGGNERDWEMSDNELLQPLRAVLKDSVASSAHMRDWATWTREYMARIDSQVRLLTGYRRRFPKWVPGMPFYSRRGRSLYRLCACLAIPRGSRVILHTMMWNTNLRFEHMQKRPDLRRVDTQGIGTSHPEGTKAGRRERLKVMRTSNPAFVLRASTLSQAIKAAEEGGGYCKGPHEHCRRFCTPLVL